MMAFERGSGPGGELSRKKREQVAGSSRRMSGAGVPGPPKAAASNFSAWGGLTPILQEAVPRVPRASGSEMIQSAQPPRVPSRSIMMGPGQVPIGYQGPQGAATDAWLAQGAADFRAAGSPEQMMGVPQPGAGYPAVTGPAPNFSAWGGLTPILQEAMPGMPSGPMPKVRPPVGEQPAGVLAQQLSRNGVPVGGVLPGVNVGVATGQPTGPGGVPAAGGGGSGGGGGDRGGNGYGGDRGGGGGYGRDGRYSAGEQPGAPTTMDELIAMPGREDVVHALLSRLTKMKPGEIMELPKVIQDVLSLNTEWRDYFLNILRMMGFEDLGDVGFYGFSSDWRVPADLSGLTEDAIAALAQMDDFGQLVVRIILGNALGLTNPVPADEVAAADAQMAAAPEEEMAAVPAG